METNENIDRLRRQRNLFATLAALLLASICLAVPRKLATYRELKAVNARLVELQLAIVQKQQQIRETEDRIERTQRDIAYRIAK